MVCYTWDERGGCLRYMAQDRLIQIVEDYYDGEAQREWERLERHRTEYAVTLRALAEYLPAVPATILDISGGPGRYAIELTKQGYQVTLLDLARGNLAFARQKAAENQVNLAAYIHANALDLAIIPDAAFDALLCRQRPLCAWSGLSFAVCWEKA